MPYKSCIVFSSPRAGTHLVMTGLWAAGMQEATALTHDEWLLSPFKVLEMPPEGFYRFGAHMADGSTLTDNGKAVQPAIGLAAAFDRSGLHGVYIERDYGAQLKSYKAYKSVVEGVNGKDADYERALRDLRAVSAVWVNVPRVLTVRYEDLLVGRGWEDVFDHLGGPRVSWHTISGHVPPAEGHPYYHNTTPSRLYYGAA